MKILVADDEPTVRRIMQAFLEKNRYEVVTVEGGMQALEVLTTEDAPKIAIIDWMMPDLTGLEVCAKLRQTKLRIQPYLCILTTKNGEKDLTASLDSGADDFLTKPFRPAEMLARLRVAERTIASATEAQEGIGEVEPKQWAANQPVIQLQKMILIPSVKWFWQPRKPMILFY